MKNISLHPIFKTIGNICDVFQIEAFVVGGYVRDLYLKRESKDIDIVVKGDGIKAAEVIFKKLNCPGELVTYQNFGTAMFHYKEFIIEIVGARKESYRSHSRNPIVSPGSMEQDQQRRDFTINAMSIGINANNFEQLIDPFNGLVDLKEKTIRTPLDPDITYTDDPLRMIRAIRFACQLSFNIEESSMQSIKKNAKRIGIVAPERVSAEINKILTGNKPSQGFYLLDEVNILEEIFPEFCALKGVDIKNGKGHKDNFIHTLQVLDNLRENTHDPYLLWAAILHDIGKPKTKKFNAKSGWTFHGHDDLGAKMVPTIFKRLKLPLDAKMKYVQKLVRLHLRPIALVNNVTDAAVRRLLYEAGEDIDDLMLLCKADVTSKNDFKVKKYRENFNLVREKLKEIEEKDRLKNWKPPIDGQTIMDTLGLKPCKLVGEIKSEIREAILDGLIENDYQQAHQYMLSIAEKYKLSARKQKNEGID